MCYLETQCRGSGIESAVFQIITPGSWVPKRDDLKSGYALAQLGQGTSTPDGADLACELPNLIAKCDICQTNHLNIRGGACSKRTLVAAATF